MSPDVFFTRALPAALAGGHVWPGYAICEAAEESAWGRSELARRANNLFGLKQGPCTAGLPTINLPTKEWQGNALVPAEACWPVFSDWASSFRTRMAVLKALAGEIPEYARALEQPDGAHFVFWVSKRWSTDPRRAANVLAIHAQHAALIAQMLAAIDAPVPAGGEGQ